MFFKKKTAITPRYDPDENFLENFPHLNLLGWPGYRNSYHKSGLGYFESNAERAHMQGLFIRWIFTGKFRTHNPIYLFAMLVIGLLCGAFPLVAILMELVVSKNYSILGVLLLGSPYIAMGVALLINVVLSLLDKDGKSITGD